MGEATERGLIRKARQAASRYADETVGCVVCQGNRRENSLTGESVVSVLRLLRATSAVVAKDQSAVRRRDGCLFGIFSGVSAAMWLSRAVRRTRRCLIMSY